ncbi:MAG: HAMP domain-containing protein [Campylobacterales bacterium]
MTIRLKLLFISLLSLAGLLFIGAPAAWVINDLGRDTMGALQHVTTIQEHLNQLKSAERTIASAEYSENDIFSEIKQQLSLIDQANKGLDETLAGYAHIVADDEQELYNTLKTKLALYRKTNDTIASKSREALQIRDDFEREAKLREVRDLIYGESRKQIEASEVILKTIASKTIASSQSRAHIGLLLVLIASVVVTAMTMMIAWALGRTILRPIHAMQQGFDQLTSSHDKIAGGTIAIEGDDEMAQLADRFNNYLAQINANLETDRAFVAEAAEVAAHVRHGYIGFRIEKKSSKP